MQRSEAWEILGEFWNNANEAQREAIDIARRDIEEADLMQTVNEAEICCARPDYEAECKRLTDELSKLKEEFHYVKEIEVEARRELAAANAKLEMVYLIFGGRAYG